MKAELRLELHAVLEGQSAVEIIHDGKLIGAAYGADGPGIRIVSKYINPLHPPKVVVEYGRIEIFLNPAPA